MEALFREYATQVRAYALRRTDPLSADDVVMEVFVVACRRLNAVPEDALPWLLGCARRVLANQRRSVRRTEALVERMSCAIASTVGPGDREERLVAAVTELDEHDREILFLSAWEGLAPSEIAQVLGCSRVAARVRLHRARRRLVQAVDAPDQELAPAMRREIA
jgi:RNA polymerase sigma-70 factor, ECF subfamily